MKLITIIECGKTLPEVEVDFGSAPDRIIKICNDSNIKFNCVQPYKGDRLNIHKSDALIFTGSSKSVYEEYEWISYLEERIIESVKFNMPILGICFGHQLVAKSLGGEVVLNPNGWELGTYPICINEQGRASSIMQGMKNNDVVYQSHQDCVMSLPEKAIELAYNNKGNQAFQINDNVFGVQFHPEFTFNVIKRYVDVRSKLGVKVDNRKISVSESGKNILNNFIKLI